MKKSITPFACLLLLVLGACTRETNQTPSRDLLIGTPTTFENVNELISLGSAFNATVLRQMFLWLADESLDPNNEGPTFAPRLARSWAFSEDRTELTFTLRDDVRWSDGVALTAEDVRFTWQAQVSPEVAYPYADIKDNIEDVEVLSPTEVRFHFSRASAASMVNAIDGGILPKHKWSALPFDQWREQPQWFQENLVTSGAFQLEAWEPRQRLVLSANPDYYEADLPKLDRVVFVNLEETTLRLNQLLAGEIDVLYGISPSGAPKIEADPNLTLHTYPSRQFSFIFWNTERPVFDDARTRRALAHGVNRQQIVDTLWGDLANPHESLISSWHWSHTQRDPLPYDPERARALLDEAGWTRTADGTRQRNGLPLRFELTTNPGNNERWDAMRMIADDLEALGVTVENRRIDFQQLNALNANHDFDATLTAFSMDTSLELGTLLHTESIDNGYNFGSYSNAEADRHIEAIRALTDIADATVHVQAIEDILRTEQPFLFLWEPMQLLASSNDVEVITDLVAPFSNLHLWSRTQ